MNQDVIVTEQEPCGQSIFCEVRIENEWSSTFYGNMYFVCNLDKLIIQWFSWIEHDKHIVESLQKLGYKLPLCAIRCYESEKLYYDEELDTQSHHYM